VDSFDKAQKFLEALGYQKSMMYEKYRITYELNDTSIMLDELPYGDFVEIEGETNDQIQDVAKKLGLSWKAAINNSYTGLFENVRHALGLSFQDLSFQNFDNVNVNPEQLGVRAADD
jgi:adenylate cyclase class 2